MKIGFFDSGLGGLFLLRSMLSSKVMSKYDYVYLGDTKNLPYGNKSLKKIYKLAVKAVEYLFKQDCELIIIACNTVSSEALRKLQQEYLPQSKFIDRKILGIIRPTVEKVNNVQRVGLIGTRQTIDSGAYSRELENINPNIKLFARATPVLAPMIEAQRLNQTIEPLKHYLQPLLKKNIQALILGCTHYGLIKKQIRKCLPKKVKIIAQEDLLPAKLKFYLERHPEINHKLSRHAKIDLQVTKINPVYSRLSKQWFGKKINLN